MRNKIALTISLASFAFATALGVGLAGAEPSTTESVLPQATTAAPAPPAPPLPVCSNGIDDDGDGLLDVGDPDCLGDPAGASEEPAPGAAPAEIAAPPVEAPAPEGEEEETLEVGSSLNAGKAEDSRGKKVVEQPEPRRLGRRQRPGGGGVAAPPATAGVQPQAIGASGGSAYLDGGSPAAGNPSVTFSPFGPAPIGVPNFVIDSFEIPPFLLPIYQACGTEYGIPWQVLASINKIETAFGTNLNVSSAGAMGWMQFIPSSWEMYGVDANGDGRKDPYNPVDAICAAGNYLKAAGGSENLYDAIFAYNHADWYVQEVLLYAQAYGKLPADLIGSLTGLTQGAHFPIAADASYADDISARAALKRATPDEREAYGNAADVIASSPDPARDQHLRRRGRAGRRRQRRGRPEIRQLEAARPLHRPPGRLRQPLHLREARQDRPRGPQGRDADRRGEARPGRQREHPPAALRAARAQGGPAAGGRLRRASTSPARSPPTAASSPARR